MAFPSSGDYDDDVLGFLPTAEEISSGTRPAATPGSVAVMIAVLEYNLWEKLPSQLAWYKLPNPDGTFSFYSGPEGPPPAIADFPKVNTLLPCLEGRLPVSKYARTLTTQNAVVYGRLSGEYIDAFLNGETSDNDCLVFRSAFLCVPKPGAAFADDYLKIPFVDKIQWERDVYSLISPLGRFATVLRSTFVSLDDFDL